ncbi:MAG: redoxin domain-containing protein [Kofleriaceae bacterium]
MRCLLAVVAIASCSAPPAIQPVPMPVPIDARPTSDGPSWIGVRIDADSLRITQLVKGAPGERAGLQIGDTLVSLDRDPVTTVPQFVARVQRTRAGERVAVVVAREGAQRTFTVTVEARPESPAHSTLIGKPAPSFTATALTGPFTPKLADLRGHVVILDFWATWCVPCTYTIPRLNELHRKYPELRIVGFSNEEPAVIAPFVTEQAIAYTIVHDPSDAIARDYLREGIPMFVVIDKAGIVREVVIGADVDTVAAAILPLLLAP